MKKYKIYLVLIIAFFFNLNGGYFESERGVSHFGKVKSIATYHLYLTNSSEIENIRALINDSTKFIEELIEIKLFDSNGFLIENRNYNENGNNKDGFYYKTLYQYSDNYDKLEVFQEQFRIINGERQSLFDLRNTTNIIRTKVEFQDKTYQFRNIWTYDEDQEYIDIYTYEKNLLKSYYSKQFDIDATYYYNDQGQLVLEKMKQLDIIHNPPGYLDCDGQFTPIIANYDIIFNPYEDSTKYYYDANKRLAKEINYFNYSNTNRKREIIFQYEGDKLYREEMRHSREDTLTNIWIKNYDINNGEIIKDSSLILKTQYGKDTTFWQVTNYGDFYIKYDDYGNYLYKINYITRDSIKIEKREIIYYDE